MAMSKWLPFSYISPASLAFTNSKPFLCHFFTLASFSLQIRAGSNVNWSITGRTINKKGTHARLDPPLHLAARRGGAEGLQVTQGWDIIEPCYNAKC